MIVFYAAQFFKSASAGKAELLIVFGLFTVGISYGTTLVIGLPWFFALARRGYAGLIPVMLSSVVPPLLVLLRARGHQYTDTGMYVKLFLMCGLLISAGYWKIARSKYD